LTDYVSESTFTYMATLPTHRSTAQVRRRQVLDAATTVFARTGYHTTTIADVAEATGISQGYVMRLFGSKLDLFVAVVDDCNERVTMRLSESADQVAGEPPEVVLGAVNDAYADMIADPNLIMVQVHAQSATQVPEIRDAVRRGLERVINSVSERSRASDAQVQRAMAFGMLCQLIVAADLTDIRMPWAQILTEGIRDSDLLA
jgi:AcrR family transcriptional regulator